MRRKVLRASLALCALGLVLAASPRAEAATVSKAAWWTRGSDPGSLAPPAARVPGVTLPEAPVAPPTAEAAEGEVVVQGAPNGALAIAAITYVLAPGESSPMLTITPGEGSNVPADAVILACRAAIDWEEPATQPGPWQSKPLVDCGRSVNGVIADDGASIAFALQPLVSGTELDVVLVAGTTGQATPAGPVGSTFQLVFDVADGAVLTTMGDAAPASTSNDQSSPSESPTMPPMSAGDTTYTAPASPIVQPALAPSEQAPTVPQVAAPAARPTTSSQADNTTQGVGLLLLLALAAVAGWAYLTPERYEESALAAAGVGRFRRARGRTEDTNENAGTINGGLGRFTGPRTGPPAPLS